MIQLVRQLHQPPQASSKTVSEHKSTVPIPETSSLHEGHHKPPVEEPGAQKQKSLQVTVVSRYMAYLNSYVNILDRKFPAAMSVYRIFMVGTKDLLR